MPSSTEPGSRWLLSAARGLVQDRDVTAIRSWQRATALLARQSLEEGLNELWAVKAPGLEQASARIQLTCLPEFLSGELATDVAYAWASLTRACHQDGYEVGLTDGELLGHCETVDRLLDRLGRIL